MPRNLLWFMYYQNNSGGVFIRNDRVGDHLFIQAHDAEEAERIAIKSTAQDQWWWECCGPRGRFAGWYNSEGPKDHPMEFNVYGVPEQDEVAILYYHDGRVKKCSDTIKNRTYFYDVDD